MLRSRWNLYYYIVGWRVRYLVQEYILSTNNNVSTGDYAGDIANALIVY